MMSIFGLLDCVQNAMAHGTVTYPPSRVWNCYQENPENPQSAACAAAVAGFGAQPLYDWNGINQGEANGNHQQFVPDGQLASGGRPFYGGMDQVRPDWVATTVSPGPLTVVWSNSAPHATAYYDVYITKPDWTPNQPLTWDALELLVRTDPSPAESIVEIPVVLPFRTGKHVIYSVWQRSDSPEAFYSASDVDFGNITSLNHSAVIPDFTLEQNYPNPFDITTTIGYKLGQSEQVTLKIYDVCGREVATLVEGIQNAGYHEYLFDAKSLPSGTYIYIFKVGRLVERKRMVLR
ncbi:MAG: lytic polysaccharide monooxygenase [Flavobacteriales bacterium]